MKGWEGEITNPADDRGNEKTRGQQPRWGNIAVALWGKKGHVQWDPSSRLQGPVCGDWV